MTDLQVPDIRSDVPPDDVFREYYRALIENSVRRSAEETGNRRLRSACRAAWIVAVCALVADLLVFGVDNWTTTVTVVAVIVLTICWFWAAAEDLLPRPGTGGERPATTL
jgi:hypothetical protein